MAMVPSVAPADRFPASARKSAFPYVLTGALLIALVGSLHVAQADPRRLLDGQALDNALRFLRGSLPPRLSLDFLALMVRPALETVQISVMGTVIAVLVGLPLGLVGASTLSWSGVLHERRSRPGRWLGGVVPYAATRALASVFRAIPEYVWALGFVHAVGLGPFPGVLAIGVAYGGMLAKVYAEILEAADPRPLEALHAGGAARPAIVLYGLVPQVLPSFVSYTLYRWECAIRASAILGLVGAGGLGQQIELSMRMFQFDEVATLLLMLLVLVTGVDLVSGRMRAWLLR